MRKTAACARRRASTGGQRMSISAPLPALATGAQSAHSPLKSIAVRRLSSVNPPPATAFLHHGAKRVLLNVGYAMGRPFSARFKARMMNAFCKYAFSGNGKWIHRSNTMYSELGLILPAGVMDEYLRAPFEDAELMIVKRWHEVLVSSYGENYMTPVRYASHDNPQHAGFRGEN